MVAWAVSLPPHVDVTRIEVMPTCQAPGPFMIKRNTR
jgi:3-hydroxy acid dehydrogenase/malonic semialdehyde reductase